MIGNRLVTNGLGGKSMVIEGLAEPGTYEVVEPTARIPLPLLLRAGRMIR